jgi:hypothetical protein
LNSRFKNEYEQAASGFTPLSELNPALSLHHELDLAVKRNDIDEVKRVIDKHRTIRPPPYGVDMTPVLASNNRELAKLLFEVTNQHFKHLIKNKEFNADWLRFVLSINALEDVDDFKVLSECIKLKRTDYVDILLEHAYDINAIEKGSGQNLLYTAIQMRDEDLLEYLLDKGIDTSIRNRWRQGPAAYARRINFIDAIEMLDDAGVYESEITRFRKQFTPDPDSRLVGKWSNLQGEFKTAVLHFHPDGSGKMLGAVAGSLIAWVDVDGSNLVIIPNIGGKLDESKQLELRYSIADNMLTIWHKDNKQMVYYRVHDQTVTEFIKQAQQSRDPQYVGSWSSNDSDAVIQIRDDGTAISGKNSYVWKNGDGNYILLLATDGEKILNGKTVRLNKDDSKDVLTVKKGRRSIMLSRVM